MAFARLPRIAILVLFRQIFRARGGRDYILLRSPIAQVDDAAALAAKGRPGIARLHVLLADGALHRIGSWQLAACGGWICTSWKASPLERGMSSSVAGSSVPTRS